MALLSRANAKLIGAPRYFTGTSCSHGHIAERYTNNATCVECHRDRINARYPISKIKTNEWKKQNRERVNKQARELYKDIPLDDRRARNKKNKAWIDLRPGYAADATKRWRKKNPGKALNASRNRKARKKAASGKHSLADVQRIYELQNGRCAMPHCRIHLKNKYEVDHIVALANGGSNWPRNLQLLCRACNLRKSSKDQVSFVQELGFLI